MMKLNDRQLSEYEIFWHLYLLGRDLFFLTEKVASSVQSDDLLKESALLVFKSIEEKGIHPLRSIGDGYRESMPEEFTKEVISDILYSLDAIRPSSVQPHELKSVFDSLLGIAMNLANSSVKYEPPIKAFIVAAGSSIYVVLQGYIVEEEGYSIRRILKNNGYMSAGWLEHSEGKDGCIRHALKTAIASGYFDGDTSIKVY